MKHKRIVVKVGTHSICDSEGNTSKRKIAVICSQIAALIKKGYEVVLVTSGAVGTGAKILLNGVKPHTLSLKQACASVGQPVLMSIYRDFFDFYQISVGQVLITGDVVNERERFLNARNTFFELLDKGVLPIVNENDTVSVEEIKFGDNDNLAVNVAAIAEADIVFILSDVEGLFADFGTEKQSLIQEVREINSQIESLIVESSGKFSTGGMGSKITAAKKSVAMGIPLVILPGYLENSLLSYLIDDLKNGTTFLSSPKVKGKKKWLFLHFKETGKITIDNGAKNAIIKDRSLLSVGIKSIEGRFEKADMVGIYFDEKKIGKGLCNYSSTELLKISGHPSESIEKILGYTNGNEVIHRDNFILNIIS
jgi:glutamate 5-kinase